MKVKDVFEIREEYQTGHSSGLVVVLDTLLPEGCSSIIGQTAVIRTPSDSVREFVIDDLRDHGPVHSLFFHNLDRDAVPVGSELTIVSESRQEATAGKTR